ncbi:uncharacterized protein BDZ99DRAFT_447096 [Mytilinidion resinicola]|uniref:DNA replication regulator SLD2 n=1 Tax=Mytilinidion resinicola TaxID=574789 RepID=A0A6A6YGR8_9PEZI|nr:uncharacterized protein BDZ99DRAFT_447096 [Mytilinidion resinicola]KAF2808002.1 hypothetical protein BDZ99DRAFT_447096 [Mytilinidion resinicola]
MPTTNADPNDRCNTLKQELKLWEKDFAAAHNGRKAGRLDIKANASISQKYKEYNKLRDVLAGKADPQTPSKAPRKRKAIDGDVRTPSKPLFKPATTPARHEQVENADPANVPGSASILFTPVHVRSKIGPTPQKDGLVLGLFDLLPSETPIKAQRTVLGDVGTNVMQTPSKSHSGTEDALSVEERARGSRTPLSAGKRFLLDKFATPKKRKRDEEGTPSSTMKHCSTPMFLRRDTRPLDMIAEEDESTPRPAPWKRRGLGRSLSSMIQNLKNQEKERVEEAKREEEEAERQEEDRLDEELEMMREMEMEAAGISIPKAKPAPKVLVEDSQVPMKLGPDALEESDQDETQQELGALDRNGNPRKAYKKRGQKRTTRRVNMRPVAAKRKSKSPEPAVQDDSDSPDAITDTQTNESPENKGSADEFGGESSDDGGASDFSNDSHTPKKRKTRHAKAKDPLKPKAKTETKAAPAQKGTNAVSKAVRKAGATMNANYRRLKIKGKDQQKGGKGCGLPWISLGQRSERSSITASLPPRPIQARTNPPTATSSQPHSVSHSSSTTVNSHLPPPTQPNLLAPAEMADHELRETLKQLHGCLQSHKYSSAPSLLSRAKLALLHLNALIPAPTTPRPHLLAARETLELGALLSIRLKDPESFTRYFQQLQPFYALPTSVLPKDGASQASKITGLYLLLLLSDGDYAGFHTTLEGLEVAAGIQGAAAGGKGGKGLEDDVFIQYPIRLEQALMEGSYDRVWGETKSERVPAEEFGLFSEVLIGTIRKEIASCSEKAYPSIPVSDAKSLLFLDSEGSVVKFAHELGWVVKDSRIYFPQQAEEMLGLERDILVTSDQVIENTLGYARELETIV